MSLVVEDGTGRSDAESFESVAGADAYHLKFGNTAWASLSNDEKEVALRKATQAICLRFGNQWQGRMILQTQALDWPRYEVYDRSNLLVSSSEIPQRLKEATSILALAASTEDVLPDLTNPGMIASESVTAGPVTTAKSYVGGKSQVKRYTRVDALVREFLVANGGVERG